MQKRKNIFPRNKEAGKKRQHSLFFNDVVWSSLEKDAENEKMSIGEFLATIYLEYKNKDNNDCLAGSYYPHTNTCIYFIKLASLQTL